MLTPPEGLTEVDLGAMVFDEWNVAVASISYRSIGWGSHHWEIVDTRDRRWFLTVDDLETKRQSLYERRSAAFNRLRASLAAARSLHQFGGTFAVAPVATRTGEPLACLRDRFGVALYPYVEGRSFSWSKATPIEQRLAVLALVIAVHAAPAEVRRLAGTDDFAIPHRDELDLTLHSGFDAGDSGPYARPVMNLLAENARGLRRALGYYHEQVAGCRADLGRMVLTHGEPHPGNTIRTLHGWRLIDWDTALVAPPERDLWLLDPGDGSVLHAYADATGHTPLPSLVELYRLRWDLADIAAEVSRFRAAHSGNADDDKAWDLLRSLVAAIGERTSL